MGIATSLNATTFTAASKSLGIDLAGEIEIMNLACQEAIAKFNFLITDVLTPAGTEAAAIALLLAQIALLS